MASIYGKVVCKTKKKHQPMAGIPVAIQKASAPHPDVAAITDTDGRFSLSGLVPGDYVIGAAEVTAKATIKNTRQRVRCDIEKTAATKTEAPCDATAPKEPPAEPEREPAPEVVPEEDTNEDFSVDPYGRDDPRPVAEAAEMSLIDKGLVYATLSLKLGQGIRDRNKLTDAAYAVLHPNDALPFSTDDPDFAEKSKAWLGYRNEIVDPLLGRITPSGPPTATNLTSFGIELQRLPDGPGYRVRRNGINWGMPDVIDALRAIGAAWGEEDNGVELVMLDISKREGGDLYPPHKSHRCGRDVDMQLRIDGKKLCMNRARYAEWRALWQRLVQIVHANGVVPVKVIGFSDPKVTGVSHWGGHGCHLHCRFAAPPDKIQDVEAALAELYPDRPRHKRPNYRLPTSAFEAAPSPVPEPVFELQPVDYLDVEGMAEAASAGLSLITRGIVYAAIGLGFARGMRGRDKLTDEGWKAAYPEAPFPLRAWHDGFAAKRRAWLEIREMVDGFLQTVVNQTPAVPRLATTCTNSGRNALRRLAQAAEDAGAPEGFTSFAEGAAWTESRWNNCAINDSTDEARAARRLFTGARSRGWFPKTGFTADEFGFGSGGWFGLMAATGLIAGGNRGPFINADPKLVTDPAASVVMLADFCTRVFRKYRAQDWLAVRRAMAALSLVHDNDEDKPRSSRTRERFVSGLERAGMDDPEGFMRRRPDTSGYPGAWDLWTHLEAIGD